MRNERDDNLPQTLVGISFADSFRAQEFMTASARLAANKDLKIHDAVIVRKDDDGDTHVVETTDPQAGRSAVSGALWASFLGLLLGGPVGWVAGGVIGAGAGAVTAKVVDIGVPDEWVQWFRDSVRPGTTTVVLLLTDVKVDALVAEVGRFAGAELLYSNLDLASFERITRALAGDSDSNRPDAVPVLNEPVVNEPVVNEPLA